MRWTSGPAPSPTPTPRARRHHVSLAVALATVLVTSTLVPTAAFADPPPAAPGAAPPVDPAPLVTVHTMVQHGDQWGVEIDVVGDVSPDAWGCPALSPTSKGFSCFYADPSNGTEWVQLVVLDRRDLHLVENRNLACPTATAAPQENQFDIVRGGVNPWTANTNPCIAGIVQHVSGLNDGQLVIAANQPGADPSVEPPVGLAATLSGNFVKPFISHDLGIGASDWFQAPDAGAHLPKAKRGTFSAIGVPHWTTGGIARLAAPDQVGKGALDATVAIDNLNRYSPLRPAGDDEAAASPVTKVLTQDPTAWPGSANAGEMAALSYLGTKLGLGPHPRSQYFSSSRDGASWQLVATAADAVPYVDTPQFAAADLAWAKQQLETEIGYLIQVQSYLAALARPYQSASPTLWSDFGAVVAQVNDTTANGTTAMVLGLAREVLDAALEVMPVFGESVAKAGHVLLSAYRVGLAAADAAGEPAESSFPVESAQLARELTNRLDAAQREIELAWRKIIPADFAKLRTVALCSTSQDGCSDPDDDWSVSLGQQAELRTVLELGFERALYTKLVPAKYPLALAIQSDGDPGRSTPNLPNLGDWCPPLPPFTGSTGSWVQQVQYGQHGRNTVYVPIALTTGNTTSNWQAAGWSVFARMFGAVDPGGNLERGGLGIDEKQFVTEAFQPRYDSVSGEGVTGPHFASSTSFASLTYCGWPS